MSRDNDHTLLGLVTLRFGWRHVIGIEACTTAQMVASALVNRGWAGPLLPCRRCEQVHDV